MKVAISLVLALLARGEAHRAGAGTAALAARADTSVAQTCRRDQSGIEWVLPFEAARARARAEQRLLFLKPIAFGTSADGGW